MKEKLRQYSKIPSKFSYAWALYLYIWISVLIILLLAVNAYGRPFYIGPNQTDIILLVVIWGSAVFSIIGAIQIIANLIDFRTKKSSFNFKQITVNLFLLIGILLFIFYTAFGD